MAAHTKTQVAPETAEQLTLNLPGFDFTSPATNTAAPTRDRALPQHRSTAAGQLTLTLESPMHR
mgnify:CR=1 FL=1